MKNLRLILLSLSVILALMSCSKSKFHGYGVVVFKGQAGFKSSDSTSGGDTATVINFQNGYRDSFQLKSAILLGSEIYSSSMQAFGYEGIELGYHFVDFKGKEVLTVKMPYKLHSVRIDDKRHLLLGLVSSSEDLSTKFVAFDYEKEQEVRSVELGNGMAFPICSSAYSADSSDYFVFAGYNDTNSILIKVNVNSGRFMTDTLDFVPSLVVFDHKSNNLIILINRVGDSVIRSFRIIRFDPFNNTILSEQQTDIQVIMACAGGFDYEKNALVVVEPQMTEDINSEHYVVLFVDPVTGKTIERHDIGKGVLNIVFWRD